MKVRVGLVVAATLVGCGGSTSSGTSSGGGSGGAGALGGTGAVGGSGGSGGISTTGGAGGAGGSLTGGTGGVGGGMTLDGQSLAVKRFFLGETDTNLYPDPAAWRKYGVNLDGLTSTPADTAHCKGQPGTPKSSIQTDGDNGIDNSWGRNLMPIMASLSASPTVNVNEGILAGSDTLVIHVQKLGPGPNQTGLVAMTYMAAPLTQAPLWNGSDARFVSFESVAGSLGQPLTAFPASNVTNGVFNAAPPTTMSLSLAGNTFFFLNLRIHHARVSATITGSGTSAKATGGIIAGVIDTEELVLELKKAAGAFDPTLCQGATFDSIAQQFRAASDIMKDGTNGDPSKTCDGISIGLGFEAVAVTLGGVAPQVPPPVDPCK